LVHKGAKNTMNISNTDFLKGKLLSIPTSEIEQIKITEFLTSIDKEIESKKKQILDAENWKKGLLQQMFA
jgi:restriction endonuclease S subunit